MDPPLPLGKKLFVNRNARLQDLENRYKQQNLTLEEYLDKLMRLIGIKSIDFFTFFIRSFFFNISCLYVYLMFLCIDFVDTVM